MQAKAVKTGPTWRSVLAFNSYFKPESELILSTSINTTLKFNNPDKIERKRRADVDHLTLLMTCI